MRIRLASAVIPAVVALVSVGCPDPSGPGVPFDVQPVHGPVDAFPESPDAAASDLTASDLIASDLTVPPSPTDALAETEPPVVCDADNDGFEGPQCGGSDCADDNPLINPLAMDICGTGVDEDCSGAADDRDKDGDMAIAAACGGPDCDDADSGIGPHAVELCGNDLDEDCSGASDDLDEDGDGALEPGCGGDDCDDLDSNVFPGATDFVDGKCTAPAAWDHTIINGQTTAFADMVVTGDDQIHVAFQGSDYLLHYARRNGSSFTDEIVDSAPETGTNVSMIRGQGGHMHITYLDLAEERMKYATDASGQWKNGLVAQGHVGWFTSLEQAPDGALHVSYWGADELDLWYARCAGDCTDGNNWSVEAVATEGEVGRYTSLELTAEGLPVIAYLDQEIEALRLARQDAGGAWTFQTADSGPGVGTSISMVMDSAGSLHLTAFDLAAGTIRYASDANGSWLAYPIATAPLANYEGHRTSIALDKKGDLHVAFNDDDPTGLKYGRCHQLCSGVCCPGAWTVTAIDTTITYGQAAALQITDDGRQFISYTGGQAPYSILKLVEAPCIDSQRDDNCDGVDGTDTDKDGVAGVQSGGTDCNDGNPWIFPGAEDPVGDQIDWNCDGAD